MRLCYDHDDLGRRASLTLGNGVVQAHGYDAVSRLTSLTNNLTGTANDLTISGIAYNPANQITAQTRSNDAYSWTEGATVNRPYSSNGLNQLTTSGSITPTYDSRGNLTSAGTTTYAYSAENMLVSATGGTSASLAYDPVLRLYEVTAGASTTRFAYDGLDQIAEYDGSNLLLRRHVHGPGTDQPLVWYEGSGTADRRFLSSDERGTIVSVSDASGNMLAINSYDEYGIPGSANAGRFQFTGQAWLPELGMYHYKARIYSPTLGRFLQTDPIGYAGGINLYAYVGNDPVNWSDPLGLEAPVIVVTGKRFEPTTRMSGSLGGKGPGSAPGRKRPEGMSDNEYNRRMRAAKVQRCAASAYAKNATSINLSALGVIPVLSTGATLAQLGIGGLSIIDSAVRGDVAAGVGGGAIGFTLTSAGPEAARAGGLWAKLIPGVGSAISAASLVSALAKARDDYNKCMSS